MQNKLLRRLNIYSGEVTYTILLALSSVMLGAFLCSYDLAAHALFFEKWKQEDLAMVYLISGVLGLILFFVYSFLHKRISFKIFHFIIFLLAILLVGFFIGNYYYSSDTGSFFVLVSMFPVNLLVLLAFWRYQRKVLLPDQTKRLFPILETGLVAGIVFMAYSSVIILKSYHHHILIGLSGLFLILFFIYQFPLNIYHRLNKQFNHRKENRIPVRSSLFIFLSNKYTRYLLLFALTSAVLGFYLHFGFLNLSRIRFTEVESFSKFYGLFLGTMFLFLWMVDRFLVRRILYSYDSPYSLVLMPVGLMVFFVLSIFGTLILRKYIGDNPLTYLIIMFGINKIVYETSHNVIQLPSLRTLYRTLDIRFLQIIYPRIEGMVVMLGLSVTGGILIGIYKLVTDLQTGN